MDDQQLDFMFDLLDNMEEQRLNRISPFLKLKEDKLRRA